MFCDFNKIFGEEGRLKELHTAEYFKRKVTIDKTCSGCDHSIFELSYQFMSEKYYNCICKITGNNVTNCSGRDCPNWIAKYPEYEKS